MKFILCLLLSIVAFAWSQDVSKKPNIAIIAFAGDKSSTPEQLDAITDRFQAELQATGRFVVLDRSQIDMILKEQGFQQSGACGSTECQVKVGQLLGVDKLISGKVVTFGGVYAFSLSYLDVGNGVVEHTLSFEVEGALIDVLKSGCKDAADQLAEKVFPAPKPLQASIPEPVPVLIPDSVTTQKSAEAKPLELPVPKVSKQAPKSRWVAIAFDALAAGALGYGIYQNSQASSNFTAYRGMANGLPQASYDTAWKKYSDAQTMRSIGYIAAGAFLAVGLTVHVAF
jgi:hypothetical protein